MGGAERAERRRRQQQAGQQQSGQPSGRSSGQPSGKQSGQRAGRPAGQRPGQRPAGRRPAAGGTGDRSKVTTGIVVGVLLVAAVIGGILWQRARSAPPETPPVETVAADYPVAVDDDGVVVAGQDTADVTVDVYEDLLCPACASFENRDAEKIEQALGDGTIKVRYHLLNMLDEQSNPPGYSLDAANAAVCAAEAGEFPSYHATLFAAQPREGGSGYSVDQLVQLGRDAGITDGAFEPCVRDGKHADAVRARFESARTDPDLRRPHPNGGDYFGTPTVLVDGTIVDIGDESWLDQAIADAG